MMWVMNEAVTHSDTDSDASNVTAVLDMSLPNWECKILTPQQKCKIKK